MSKNYCSMSRQIDSNTYRHRHILKWTSFNFQLLNPLNLSAPFQKGGVFVALVLGICLAMTMETDISEKVKSIRITKYVPQF